MTNTGFMAFFGVLRYHTDAACEGRYTRPSLAAPEGAHESLFH
jgi:hypothetical protein